MKVYNEVIKLRTNERLEFLDITNYLKDILKRSGIEHGFINVFSKHTTLALKINEYEPLLLKDMRDSLNKLFPVDKDYFHDKIELRENCPLDEPKNADGHLKCLFLETSQLIPMVDSQMVLGKWQRIIAIETSGPRVREIEVQIMGK